jgi:hypothetical protein
LSLGALLPLAITRVACVPGSEARADQTRRVSFPRAQNGTVIADRVVGDEGFRCLMAASAGQGMRVSLTAGNSSADLNSAAAG